MPIMIFQSKPNPAPSTKVPASQPAAAPMAKVMSTATMSMKSSQLSAISDAYDTGK
jgi:hypothetical protein